MWRLLCICVSFVHAVFCPSRLSFIIVSQSVDSAPKKALQLEDDTRASGQSKNDANILAYAKKRVVQLEHVLKTAQAELKTLTEGPALATKREVLEGS